MEEEKEKEREREMGREKSDLGEKGNKSNPIRVLIVFPRPVYMCTIPVSLGTGRVPGKPGTLPSLGIYTSRFCCERFF